MSQSNTASVLLFGLPTLSWMLEKYGLRVNIVNQQYSAVGAFTVVDIVMWSDLC